MESHLIVTDTLGCLTWLLKDEDDAEEESDDAE